ncbi:MocR-like pyridoxine biosynthesis transcription factor PdxR [Phytomonospora endophytica]|uniref:GntR family transcriptional regulator/MocR family aminotransferase n=1 Tax=Phytomonospora endophytica TaxID=714109 RepID=A0A841FYM1_9ACTN|nr:PLP-dependent aminotransferase family protein [Phytomonospora endophytica]MBB6037060.1 GntR family transcriptional regulator/MocR family aminotransferase [Phytomonospora endophytica]GIG69397.1 GntR family transcriptional regulator [Phytomonospora endophytica]
MPDLHLTLDVTRRRGLARDLAGQLREAVRDGRLAAGAALPPSRVLAADLGVSRGVVVEAYAQLTAEGFLSSAQGSGTRVADVPQRPVAPVPPTAAPAPAGLNMRVGTPDLTAFPRRQWLTATRHVLATLPHSAFGYPDPGGVEPLREVLAGYLRRVRAASVTAADLTVVGGVAHGLSLLMRALGPRDLAVEDPTSPRQLPLLTSAGARLHPVPVDAEGMDIAALSRGAATAVLLTPAHQYPTGVVLSAARRAALGEWLDRPGAVAVEDDYDAEFRYDRDPVGCLQGLRPDRTVLIGSVSKALAPGLRLGWIAAPPAITAAIRRIRAETDLGSPMLEQHVLARLIETGEYDRHVRAMRQRYRSRRDALIAALARHIPGSRAHGVSAGQHLYVELPPGADEAAVVARARELGLDLPGGSEYRLASRGPAALVIGFAGLSERVLDDVVARLGQAVTT